MSFQQGLSGLYGASKNLDVIGNNIANVSTMGYKASRTEFADVYANSLYGSGGVQIGIGTQIVNVAQQFTQGNITITNNPLDVAINGDGFFRVNDNGAVTYTRNGQFHLDKDGYLVTNTGLRVMGYTTLTLDANNAVVGASDLGDIQINLENLAPNPTAAITLTMNLDAEAPIVPGATPFSPANSSSYNFSTTVAVYDSEGVDHTMVLFYTKRAANSWEVNATLDGTQLDMDGDGVGASAHTVTFNPDGSLAAGGTITPSAVGTAGVIPIAGANDLDITISLTGTTQYAGGSGVTAISQDGYARGRVVGLSIDDQGIISGRYTNGLTRPLQQLVLANFRNPNALVPLGNNQWAANSESGAEVLNAPGEGIAGLVQSGAAEESNVDLTGELVNLIVAQRLYQANAQTIRAQDQILQTLVNLR